MEEQWQVKQDFSCLWWMDEIQQHTLGQEGQEKNLH